MKLIQAICLSVISLTPTVLHAFPGAYAQYLPEKKWIPVQPGHGPKSGGIREIPVRPSNNYVIANMDKSCASLASIQGVEAKNRNGYISSCEQMQDNERKFQEVTKKNVDQRRKHELMSKP